MNSMDFDALMVQKQGFNTLDNLASSVATQQMSQQTLQAIQTMQTPMPKGHIPQHVVLPVFQNKAESSNINSANNANIFVVLNGVQKGPFTLEQLKGLAIADVIDENTQVWTPNLPSWLDLKNFLANYK